MLDEKNIPRLSRLSAILTLLQSKRIITSTDISKKFGISKRTAYRDIKALEASGVPIYTEEGKGYSLLEGYCLPPIMFSEDEANALITAAEFISKNKDQSLVENHCNAIEKIKSVLRYSNKEKTETLSERIYFASNYKNEITSNNLSTIQKAITNRYLIEIEYLSISKNENTKRKIEAQALYHTQENWILIAWCHLRKDYREFRLDRIEKIKVLKQHFESRNFKLRDYFKSFKI